MRLISRRKVIFSLAFAGLLAVSVCGLVVSARRRASVAPLPQKESQTVAKPVPPQGLMAALRSALALERKPASPQSCANGAVWTQQAQNVAADGQADDRLGLAVAIDGDTAVIGAPLADIEGNEDAGAAYVFTRSGATWTQQAKLTASNSSAGDQFGAAVAVSGDTVLVGAPFKNGRFPDQGRAYFFSRSGATWTEIAILVPQDFYSAPGDLFGASVALQGNTALIGAPLADNGQQEGRPQGNKKTSRPTMLVDSGAVYIAVLFNGNWIIDTNIVESDVQAGDHFGSSVALANGTYLVGSDTGDQDPDADVGVAYVYLQDAQTGYAFAAKLAAADLQTGAGFGASVAVKGDTALVGAPAHDVSGNSDAGAAYIFQRSAGSWTQQMRLTATGGGAGDFFGESVALATDTALVGAPLADPSGVSDAGAAFVFAYNGAAWTQEASLALSGAATDDELGGAVAISGDTVVAGANGREVGATANAGAAFIFLRECNTPPSITPETVAPRQQGSAGSAANLATLNDDFTASGSLTVATANVPSGLSVTGLTNTNGAVAAQIEATCAAATGDNTFDLRVTDEHGATTTASISVTVTANTPPALGGYSDATATNGGGATATPSAAPTDNGTISDISASASGAFTGNLAVNAAGVVTITNAGPAGSYTVTVTATDNCGATTNANFALTVNGVPTITPAAAVARQQGSNASNAPVATVSDDATPAGSLTVAAINVPPGLTVNNIVNTNGSVTADIAASCAAGIGANTVVLEVTDGSALTSTANFTVNVIANAAPTLGAYPNNGAGLGGSATVTPSVVPSDNGSVASVTATASGGFTGNVSVNAAGVVAVTNAAPSGVHTITVTATDNCGATTSANFTLTVNGSPTITPAAAVSRQQGSNGSVSPVATISDDLTALNNLTVSAQSVPPGLILNGLTNANGNVTANIVALCGATPGANTIVLQVLDEGGLTATANFTVNVTANTPPTLGAYSGVSLAPGGSTTATPSAAPTDNGSVSNISASASGGFTGSLAVSAAGVVTITNAGPAGSYTVTVTATDNCGATANTNFALNINGSPSITPAAAVARQQGSAGGVSPIATVSDDATPAGSLIVAASNVPAGLSVSGLTNNNGNVTANIAADCSATVGANNITVSVTDGQSLMSTANFTVNVTANTAPALGAYSATALMPGASATVTPSAPPADNGSVSSVTVSASVGFTGSVNVNAAGVVSVTNAGPSGSYTITVTATDNCGAISTANFTLTVNSAPTVTPAAPLSRQQGSVGSVSSIATISDDLTPAANLSVTASNVPAGLSVSGLTNTNGAISANVAAGCVATVGANTFTLNVTDGAGLSANASVTVNVTANDAPTLGSYAATLLSPGGAATVTPTAAPLDNGAISNVTVAASGGFTGNLSVNAAGLVSITNAGPSGAYTVTVTATDNCGATATASLTLTVNGAPTITPSAAVTRQQGSAGSASPVATISDDLTAAGNLTVAASNIPAGLSVANVTNNNGNVTAEIAAGCAATPGANAVTFTVTDEGGLSANAVFTVNITVNTPPALGVYNNAALNSGGNASLTPSLAPADNGSIASLTVAASNGFTGNVSVNAAGVVTITNAAPSGVHAITVTATDNCGATATASLTLTVNGAPTITPAASVSRQQGSAGATSPIATVSDDLTAAGSLTVTASNVPTGLSVTNPANNNGAITADITANCAATVGANTFTLTVTDGNGLSSNASFTVSITANTAPTLGNYGSISLMPGNSATVTPSAPPADNGSISGVTVAASAGFTGSLSVDAQTGVVSVTNSTPSGSYTITVTATDNCGATTSANFMLNINGSPTITPAAAILRQQGSAGTTAALATVSDDLTPAGGLSVVASNIPAGLTISNLVNNNGSVTATIAASCGATLGANIVTVSVTDGNSLTASANFTVNVTANTAPTLGSYAATLVNSGASATVTPGVAPADNGSVGLTVAASNGFTGAVSVNAAGVVNISNAAPSGSHTITVTATDNCGATTSASFVLTVNNAPTVNAAAPLTRQQGSAGFTSNLATVSDDATPAGSLTVAATSIPNGIALNGLANTNGTVSAQVTAGCGAAVGANTVVLTVTDGGGLTTNANITVNIAANTGPMFGAYTSALVNIGQSRALTPTAPPTDNGVITGVTVAVSNGFSGTVTVNAETGVVLVNNAGPAGSHVVTVAATDNCGVTAAIGFTLQVASPTLAHIENFTAYRAATGNTVRWQSSYEVDNLGFNVYRQEGKRRVKLTPALIAGSALSVGPNALTAGDSYAWRDAAGQANSVYWVEDIDLQGRRALHGPLSVKDEGGRMKDEAESAAPSRLISELPANDDAVRGWPTAHRPASGISNLVSGSDAWQRQLQLAAGPAVKIAVRAAGWYRVTGAQLQAAGFSPNTDARLLQLYADGAEQAITARAANGTDNGPLGLDGAIEFYGVAQDTRESDTRNYWLIAGNAPGLRIGPPVRVAPRGGDTPLSTQSSALSTSFPYTVERRERLAYFAALRNGDAENFFGAMVNDAAPVAQALSVNNLDATATQPAAVSVALQGLTQTPHRVRVTLNGAELGTVSFSGQELKTARFNAPPSSLNEGANTVTYQALEGATDVSAIAFTRITYARRYRAENDRLSFTGNGSTHLRVEGFSNPNVRVFDVTDPQRVFALAAQTVSEAAGYTVIVNGAAGRSYVAVANAQTPANIAANAPSNWTSANQRADLLIVAHRDFMSTLEPLAALRRSQGLETVIVDVADIYDEWNAGAADTEALRGFLRWAQQNWQLAPRYLLLAGDASYDPRSYLGGSRTDFVPTRFVDTTASETASDESLVDFDGDGLGEYAVGRLPARTAAQAQTMVSKLINYTPGQAQGALFVADQAEGYDFAVANQQLRAELPAAMPAAFINRGSQPDSTIRAELINALNAGPSLVTYSGHGAPEAWAGLILNSANANGLTNGARLPFVVTLTCLNGAFQHPQQETLAESLLRAPNGGAVAVWASSGMTLPQEQMPMARELYRRLYSSDAPLLGDALRAAKASVEFAELRSTWILFGDPTLRFR